jgi:outer membrane protein OmpA-like peptidoglycan-associated protein
MRIRSFVALALACVTGAALPAQQSSTGSSATSRAKELLGSAADTALTSAASMVADTLLAANGGMAPAKLAPDGSPICEPGMIAIPAHYVTGGAPASASMPSVPTPGSALVGAAKKKLSAGDDADTTAAAPLSGYLCGTPEQVSVTMQNVQAASVGGNTHGVASGITSALGATRKGAMVSGAVASAPLAGKAAKKLGGMFGRGAQTSESMKKDLGKGRLTVKKLEFVEGSDELAEGFEEHLTKLAEALQSVEGRFELRVPAESDTTEPNMSLAEKRVQRVFAHLLVAGVPADRLTPVAGASTTRRNDARLEVVAIKSEGTP